MDESAREDDLAEPEAAVSEPAATWLIELADATATEDLGYFLAEELRRGDVVALGGSLGAGKTTLARAIVRALAADDTLEVPSPTFTLMQSYDTPRGPVVHADLYRIGGAHELAELGWDEALDHAIVLVEWPERAAATLPASRLEIQLDLAPGADPDVRRVTLRGLGTFGPRLQRARTTKSFLARVGWGDAARILLQGDASTRAYERLVRPTGETAILMISPPRPDGPPVRAGRPYSAIAKLAESVHAFVALAHGLVGLGFSAPRIFGEDLEAGLLVIEDLGAEPVVDEAGPIQERYGEATRLLATMHGMKLRRALPMGEGRYHKLPPYDMEALLIEVELLADWYAPFVQGAPLPDSARAEFLGLWSEVLAPLVGGPTTWTFRDFHSPNLIWLPEREGIRRVGLLDFQDAVLGHPAYDVVSLLQDARVTASAELELKLLALYARERTSGDPSFDMAEFARAYAILGAQRATKILGIFARLDRRDGKPQYLKHLPRIEAYLARNLAHPVLTELRRWYQSHLPRLVQAPEQPAP